MTIKEIREQIEIEAKRLGLDANKLMREYGVSSALLEMLKNQS